MDLNFYVGHWSVNVAANGRIRVPKEVINMLTKEDSSKRFVPSLDKDVLELTGTDGLSVDSQGRLKVTDMYSPGDNLVIAGCMDQVVRIYSEKQYELEQKLNERNLVKFLEKY